VHGVRHSHDRRTGRRDEQGLHWLERLAESQVSTGQRRIVLGLGNTLNTDEGVGVHALTLLQREAGKDLQFEFLDGGTLGLNLLPLVEETSHLLLLDAVDAGETAGTVIELRREDIPLFAGVKLSQHQLTFQEVLGLARVRGKLPEHLCLIGVQPSDLSIGVGMSGPVLQALPEVLTRAKALLRMWTTIERCEG
jgi:hydrogenase maturation protease